MERGGSLCTNCVVSKWTSKTLCSREKKNCKIDFVCNPVIILFPSYISLIRVLNVDIFESDVEQTSGFVVEYITMLIERT